MKISIVTGTFNRYDSLMRMIESVRKEVIKGLDYEIVVVDGGSTDQTISWCKLQKDVVLIEHGRLLGAIKAFCDGAFAAKGKYVVMANDDIIFMPYSLIAAVGYLENTPTCGGVAFADNRTSFMTKSANSYRVEGMGATDYTGKKTMVHYAQVGMFRKEVGDNVGWWGVNDEIMGKAKTYGGDNYLSSRIWELGLSIDAVDECQIHDFIQSDGLREHNGITGRMDSAAYYERFPTVKLPQFLKAISTHEVMRILYMPIYEWTHTQKVNLEKGMWESLSQYAEVLEWDYLNDQRDLVKMVKSWKPHMLLTQIQGSGPKFTPFMLANARKVHPSMVVINWNGDAHEQGLIYNKVISILKYVDIQTTINAKVLPIYKQLGIKAAYWQIGYKDPIGPVPDMPTYDVLFQGNCYDVRRTEIARFIRSLPYKTGIYGNCQDADGNTHYSFAHQFALYSRAKITIGDTFPGTIAFASNRFFQSLAAGAFLLHQRSDQFDHYNGTKAGVHYVEWNTLDDLRILIDYFMDPTHENERKQIAECGKEYVRKNFSYDAQVRKLFIDIIPLLGENNA